MRYNVQKILEDLLRDGVWGLGFRVTSFKKRIEGLVRCSPCSKQGFRVRGFRVYSDATYFVGVRWLKNMVQ